MAYTKVMKAGELSDGSIKKVNVGGHSLLIYREGEAVYAVSSRCTHLGLPLSARQDRGIVTCPFHGSQYDLKTGEVKRLPLSNEWKHSLPLGAGGVAAALIPKKTNSPLTAFSARIEGGEIQVELEPRLVTQ